MDIQDAVRILNGKKAPERLYVEITVERSEWNPSFDLPYCLDELTNIKGGRRELFYRGNSIGVYEEDLGSTSFHNTYPHIPLWSMQCRVCTPAKGPVGDKEKTIIVGGYIYRPDLRHRIAEKYGDYVDRARGLKYFRGDVEKLH